MADITTVAAFTAAGLGLVNAVTTGRMARRGSLQHWRRDAERPLVADIVRASTIHSNCVGDVMSLAEIRHYGVDPTIHSVKDIEQELGDARREEREAHYRIFGLVTELELIAGREVQHLAEMLRRHHSDLSSKFAGHEPFLRETDEDHDKFPRAYQEERQLQEELVAAARREFGMDAARLRRWR